RRARGLPRRRPPQARRRVRDARPEAARLRPRREYAPARRPNRRAREPRGGSSARGGGGDRSHGHPGHPRARRAGGAGAAPRRRRQREPRVPRGHRRSDAPGVGSRGDGQRHGLAVRLSLPLGLPRRAAPPLGEAGSFARTGTDVDRGVMTRRLLPLIALALALGAPAAEALRLPSAPRCPVFPKTNPWNRRVDKLPVAQNSAAIIASIGTNTGLHADFGSGLWDGSPIGIPYDVVSKKTSRSRVTFEYSDESDHVRYPIPKRVHIEGGSDHHALLVDKTACRLYELGGLEKQNGRWHAWAGATWSLRSNHVRPAGGTSADAAGLPIFAGLARYDEVKRGVVDHALRFTVQRTRRAYVFPARHYASDSNDSSLPPMGLRLRLKASFDVSGYPRQARIVLVALKRYGMMVADNGSSWYITGAPSPGWSNDQLH